MAMSGQEFFKRLSDRIRSGEDVVRKSLTGRVGSGRVGSGRVGSGRVGSGRVGSGRRITPPYPTRPSKSDPTRKKPWNFVGRGLPWRRAPLFNDS